MQFLVPQISISIITSFVMTVLYFYLHTQDRKSFLYLWIRSGFAFTLASFLQLLMVLKVMPEWGLIFRHAAMVSSALLLANGLSFLVTERSLKQLRIWIAVGFLTTLLSALQEAPVFLFLGALYVWSGMLLFRSSLQNSLARRIVGGSLLLGGLYCGVVAGLGPTKPFLFGGELLSFLLLLSVSLGLLGIYLDKIRSTFRLEINECHHVQERLKAIIQHQPACIKTVATDGTVLAINPAGLAMLEASQCPEKIIGRNVIEFICPEDREAFLDLHQKACAGQVGIAQFKVIDLQGKSHWMESYSAPLHFSNEKTKAVLSVTHDITERKLTEQKLIESYEELKNAKLEAEAGTKTKSKFLANMSHEIRTPIGAILGYAELMLKRDLKVSERMDYVNTILCSGRQLLEIIDEILDISKVEAGHLEIEILDVNLRHLLKDLWALMRIKAEEKGIPLNFCFKSLIPEHIFCDPIRLRQILLNIISNAIKFTEKGQVTVEAYWIEGRLKFRVLDTGVGIEADEIDKLFQPFSQVNNSISRRFGGTGLGLVLARTIGRSLGGDVYLESSEVGRGSVFVVEVKAAAVENTLFIADIEMVLPRSLQIMNEAEEARLLEGISVLLVEDSPINQTLISRFLTVAGAKIDFANNGIEGLEKALTKNFDIVLMDIQMPEMDGYEATTKLRQQGYQRPIIALTAHAMKEEREHCLNVGMSDFLTKPINRSLLISQILNYLHH
ncbi:MAG TPA: response regulator [Pseudobdellovibrionaceae bacterium]|jgi:PAS domain S-box-containing protein